MQYLYESVECALEKPLPSELSGFTATFSDGQKFVVQGMIASHIADIS